MQEEIGLVRFGTAVLPCGVEKALSEYFHKGSSGNIEVDAGPFCNHTNSEGTVRSVKGPLYYRVSLYPSLPSSRTESIQLSPW